MILEDLKVRIQDIKTVAESTRTFVLEKPKDLSYKPGQHMYLEIEPDRGTPFSFVSSPTQDIVQFATIIRDKSDFKQDLNGKKKGDELILSAPYGEFIYEEEEEKIGLIAGGIGITPYMCILRYIADKKTDTDVAMLYSNKSVSRTAFKDELDELAGQNGNIKIVYTMTDESWEGETGRIDADFVRKHVEDFEDRIWYVAGPPKMVGAMKEMLRGDLKVENVKLDAFEGY